ncbi:hypothetical protein RFM68_15310 [Mesorhizobium sp. MSK_1335]|uniref:Uncharacterized protein n=1 Tax=Mesorhizobium montanum TaxID=3072323 RepID=A0ABU4ZLL1_9HYPH|nr:hypothetical protein [Mesorhizobium sp. MSK_1335]MDX8525880.1 hypothetical protein [Mesorhizobium sp. MSK_1335]
MIRKSSVHRWLAQELSSGSKIKSTHFDEFIDYSPDKYSRNEILNYSIELIAEISGYISESFHLSGVKFIVVFIPLSVTADLKMWNEELLSFLGKPEEPPAVYVIFEDDIFGNESEEYRRPIEVLSQLEKSGVLAIFRSFRDRLSMTNEWEFTNGIYLVRRV